MQRRRSGTQAKKWIEGVAAVLLISTCGCAVDPQPVNANTSQLNANLTTAPAATVSFCDNPAPGCTTASSFSVSTLRDLNVRVNLSNVAPGNHVEVLKIVHPGGGLYQSFRNSFVIQQNTPGIQTTMNAMPVSGTWIAQRGMTGTWSVQVFLDGQLLEKQSVILTK